MQNISLGDWDWSVCKYQKAFAAPFAELITVNESKHQLRDGEAKIAWEFFKHFRRDENGKVIGNSVKREVGGKLQD